MIARLRGREVEVLLLHDRRAGGAAGGTDGASLGPGVLPAVAVEMVPVSKAMARMLLFTRVTPAAVLDLG